MRRASGFTLLELVLVLSLFAAMAALSLPVLRYLQVQGQQVRAQAQRVESERALSHWLREALQRAAPIAQGLDQNSGRDVIWRADAGSVRFTGLLPPSVPQTGPYVQEFAVQPSSDGVALHYRWALTGPGDTPAFNSKMVLNKASKIVWSYRRFVAGGRLSEWQSQWPDATDMPAQVRLQVWRKPSGQPIEIVVALPKSTALTRDAINVGPAP